MATETSGFIPIYGPNFAIDAVLTGYRSGQSERWALMASTVDEQGNLHPYVAITNGEEPPIVIELG